MTWALLANRGAFTMIVMTQARASMLAGIVTHPQAPFVGILDFDGDVIAAINFLSIESVREFIRELAPRSIVVKCAPGEDEIGLTEALLGKTRDVLH